MLNFFDRIDGAEFKRGDKVRVAGYKYTTFEVLSLRADRDGSFSYRVIELDQFGNHNNYRKSIVPAVKVTKA